MITTVFVGTSLDGFLARPDGSFDFLPADPEPHGFEEFFASVDALVIGRKTFETAASFPGWPYEKKPVIVLTSTPSAWKAPDGAVCEFMNPTPQEVIDRLTQRGMKHLYIDGGLTIQRFLEAGLITRLVITRVPVLIGVGIPLFGPLSRDVRVEHVATRSYPSGLVQSEYTITGK